MSRQALANLLSVSLTVAALAIIAAVAVTVSSHATPVPSATRAPEVSLARPTPQKWPRLVGVTADPWHSDEWTRALRVRPDIVMIFRAWSRTTPLTPMLEEAARRRLTMMFTWEPWRPVHRSSRENGRLQPGYSNAAIAAGRQDPYIRSVAREIARHPGTVIIRYAHEMTGVWYPWHHSPEDYKAGWRRIRRIFDSEGATNVVWVWSVNSNIREPHGVWWEKINSYYPGDRYVDVVGATTVRSSRKQFTVAQFGRRLHALRAFGKPVWMTEVAASEARERFLVDLARFVRDNPWVRGLIWSQVVTIPEPGWTTSRLLGRVFRQMKRPPVQFVQPDAHDRG